MMETRAGEEMSLGEESDSAELIASLRRIIAEQEERISQLQQNIKRMERRYRQQAHQSPQHDRTSQKSKSNDLSLPAFTRELALLQDKHQKRNQRASSYESVGEISLREVLQVVQKLYHQVDSWEIECKAKTRALEESSKTIEGLSQQLNSFRENFQKARDHADRYQSELLEQIRRLEDNQRPPRR